MNLDIVLIDQLAPDGVLNSYRISPKSDSRRVVIDRLWDIFPDHYGKDDVDLGGTRIYNASQCLIDRFTSRPRAFRADAGNQSFHFQFEHMGIPLGSSKRGHGGMYNLVFPPGWRCQELFVSDPYDHGNPHLPERKQFQHSVIWDPECSTQLVEMSMRSGRGSFSFIVSGTVSIVSAGSTSAYLEARESSYSVKQLSDVRILDKRGRDRLSQELAEKSDWLELKPNVFGVGVNLNQVVKDAIRFFQKKVAQKE